MKMSNELAAMLARPRDCQTSDDKRKRLESAANRALRKSGYYPKRDSRDDVVVDAEACGVHGLRPTWHGKA